MPANQHLQKLSAALSVSEEMMSAAREAAWDRLSALMAERQALIQDAFAEPIPHADAPAVADLIRRIQVLNQCLVDLSSQGRDRVAGALGAIAAGRRARAAYGGAPGR